MVEIPRPSIGKTDHYVWRSLCHAPVLNRKFDFFLPWDVIIILVRIDLNGEKKGQQIRSWLRSSGSRWKDAITIFRWWLFRKSRYLRWSGTHNRTPVPVRFFCWWIALWSRQFHTWQFFANVLACRDSQWFDTIPQSEQDPLPCWGSYSINGWLDRHKYAPLKAGQLYSSGCFLFCILGRSFLKLAPGLLHGGQNRSTVPCLADHQFFVRL